MELSIMYLYCQYRDVGAGRGRKGNGAAIMYATGGLGTSFWYISPLKSNSGLNFAFFGAILTSCLV